MQIGIDACCWSNKRGFGRFTRELLNALIALDRKNDYYFFVDKETQLACLSPERVNIAVAPTRVSPTEAASANGRRSLRDLWVMSREVLKHDIDLFFFPAVYSYYPILNRTKIIVTIHDMIPKLHPQQVFPNKKLKFFWTLKEYVAVRQANLILTVSENSKQEITKFYNFPASRVRTISEGTQEVFKILDKDRWFAKVLQNYQIYPSDRYIIYVGGISPHKNLKTLVEAHFELIKDSLFSDVKLVLVGDYTNDSFYSNYSTLQELVEKLNLKEKVIFTGYVEDRDLAFLYNASLLLVFPSLQEGFGLPAVEAMACGTPVAASNLGSLPEIVGDAGLLFDPLDKDDLLGVLKKILSDYDLRENMRRKGLERVRQFSWEKAAQNLLSIFENLVNT
ncbi:MAG: glycosyltransferase family 4 protein [Candidatus Hodarchaeales archaeon]